MESAVGVPKLPLAAHRAGALNKRMVCTSLETAHAAVRQLVHDFAEREAHFLAPAYSEAQARVDFIDNPNTRLVSSAD